MKWKIRREADRCDAARCDREWQVAYRPEATSCRMRDRRDGMKLCDVHHAALIEEEAMLRDRAAKEKRADAGTD